MMKNVPLVFLVDDDEHVLESVRTLLTDGMGYTAATFGPGQIEHLLRRAVNEKPDLIILDHHLSDTLKGADVLVHLRDMRVRSMVLFLSGEKDPDLRVATLNLTADDFVSKPFSPPELMARINAMLRRRAQSEDPRIRGDTRATDDDFPFCGCSLSPRAMVAISPNGKKKVKLTPYIIAVAQMLHRYRGSVITRKELLHTIWGADRDEKTRTLDQAIYDLRGCIGKAGGDTTPLANVKGVGYLYERK